MRINNDGVHSSTPAIWIYEGALYDPLEGKRIANVQGLELVTPLATCRNDDPISKSNYKDRCGDLIAGNLLSSTNATFDYASTVLSRKLFCYTREEASVGQSADDRGDKKQESIITSIRLRHKSPLKHIPTDQAVSLYETATTVIERGGELVMHSEWPSGRSLWGTTRVKQQLDRGLNPASSSRIKRALEFTVYTRSKKDNQQPDLTVNEESLTEDAAVVSPKRSALIQFGTSKMEQKNRYGARETYSYINIPNDAGNEQRRQGWKLPNLLGIKKRDDDLPCQVRYTRYGEGPPFYAPGRMCSLELRGRRVQSYEEIPPVISSLINDRIPGFLQPATPHSLGDDGIENEINVVKSNFRASNLQLLADPSTPPPTWFGKRHANALLILNDISQTATKLQSKITSIWSLIR